MKILVLNGSPKGKYSITLQHTRYLEKLYPNHTFEVLNVGQKIKSLTKDFAPAREAIAKADVLLFSYPVYTFIAPCQLHKFIELLKGEGMDLSSKYATQISTSKHFYDVTAHRYVQDNCADLGLRYIKGLSADMDDLLTEKGQSMTLYCGDVAINEISWFSDDESIALFSQGVVVALNAGETVVYAEYRGMVISCNVVCDVDPEAPAPYVDPALLQSPRLGIPYVEDPSDTSFFDDAAFIGDSVSYVLQQWNLKHGNFGNAVFLARSSLGLQNTIDGRLTLNYQGVSYSPEDALAAAGAKKLFVMLGFNDLNLFGIDGTLERWDIFLERIIEKNPDIQIYIQSCTPVHKDGQAGALNNENIDAYNETLKNYCQEHGYHFVDVASYMKDYRNSLVPAFCSDGKMHITYDGAVVWEYVLKAYAEQQRLDMEGENQ